MAQPDGVDQIAPFADESIVAAVSFAESPLQENGARRVFAAVLLDPAAPAVVAERVGLDLRRTMRVLGSLAASGLVESHDGTWSVVTARLTVTIDRADLPAGTPIPRRAAARDAFLRRAAELFEPGAPYPEVQVNRILAEVNPDFAALRRYLVEAQLLSRSNGIYVRG